MTEVVDVSNAEQQVGGGTGTLPGVILQGQDVTTLPAHRRPVNTVFQSYALFGHMTVARNVFSRKSISVSKK